MGDGQAQAPTSRLTDPSPTNLPARRILLQPNQHANGGINVAHENTVPSSSLRLTAARSSAICRTGGNHRFVNCLSQLGIDYAALGTQAPLSVLVRHLSQDVVQDAPKALQMVLAILSCLLGGLRLQCWGRQPC